MKQEGLILKEQQVCALKLLSEGRDVFVWFPTGYGKSLCYQLLPFLMDYKLGRTKGPLVARSVVLVISPLVSLMIDQVRSLNTRGVSAAILSSNKENSTEVLLPLTKMCRMESTVCCSLPQRLLLKTIVGGCYY